MADFEAPADLTFNRGRIADPAGFAHEHRAASWLSLCGDEFAGTDGGMSYAQVQAATVPSVGPVFAVRFGETGRWGSK